VTQLRKKMLDELQRLDYSKSTARVYLHVISELPHWHGTHPHIHCVIPAGGPSPDRQRWVHPRYHFFLPRHVLSRVFRGKFVAALKRHHSQLVLSGALQPLRQKQAFASFLRPLFRQQWVVYLKPPFGSPQHVLRYFAAYTHRVAISNHRLVAFQQDQVTFRWKDYAHGNKKRMMTLCSQEFLRRFLLHVLPRGFVRIRFYGFLAQRRRAHLLSICHQLLQHNPEPVSATQFVPTSSSVLRCPRCASPLRILELPQPTFTRTSPRYPTPNSS
jgi:Putative transposase